MDAELGIDFWKSIKGKYQKSMTYYLVIIQIDWFLTVVKKN